MNSISTEENLLVLTIVARFGSSNKVAEESGLATSAISYTIKRMETGLDVVLFTRSIRSIELTESGRHFFRKATDLLNDFYAVKRNIDTTSQGIEARMRIRINQLLYTPKHAVHLSQVLKKQFLTCQITVTTEAYSGAWDAIISNQTNIAIGAPDTLLGGGDAGYIGIGTIRRALAIAPDHLLAFVSEPIAESRLHLYPNTMVEDTAYTINKKVGWLSHGQGSILVPDFNARYQRQISGEGVGFLPDYMIHEAMAQSLLVTRQIHNPCQDSRMLLATQHSATGQVMQQIKKQLAPSGILTGIYQDLLYREN